MHLEWFKDYKILEQIMELQMPYPLLLQKHSEHRISISCHTRNAITITNQIITYNDNLQFK